MSPYKIEREVYTYTYRSYMACEDCGEDDCVGYNSNWVVYKNKRKLKSYYDYDQALAHVRRLKKRTNEEMIITKNENIRPFDVDGTLIIHTKDPIKPSEMIRVCDPVTGAWIRVRINKPMVRLLKEENQRGSYVIVWSRGGWEWARNVVQALDLVTYVDHIMSKPTAYMDDSPVKKWMKDRVFIGPDEAYKESK